MYHIRLFESLRNWASDCSLCSLKWGVAELDPLLLDRHYDLLHRDFTKAVYGG